MALGASGSEPPSVPARRSVLGFATAESRESEAVTEVRRPYRNAPRSRSVPWCGRACLVLGLATLILPGPGVPQPTDSSSFKLIVHPDVAGSRIPKAVVASIFLCQVSKWGDGATIKVLDRSMTSPVRVAFGNEILGMSKLEVGQYWRRQISRGKVPPPTEESEEAAVAFVAANPGSVAYVAADTVTPSTVKVIAID